MIFGVFQLFICKPEKVETVTWGKRKKTALEVMFLVLRNYEKFTEKHLKFYLITLWVSSLHLF